jgi:phospholipid/cholesterol/gamma-HCH transport system substrate-binding protein
VGGGGDELAQTFKIFPTFNTEAKLTLDRLERFARNAGPLFHDLRPVARDLSPTLRDVRRLAPHAKQLFDNFDPLIKASATGLPALHDFLDQLRPALVALDPFLANLNPVVRYLAAYRGTIGDFFAGASATAAGRLQPGSFSEPGSTGHALRTINTFSAESLGMYPNRLPTNRGNSYIGPFRYADPRALSFGIGIPSFDCNNTGVGEKTAEPDNAACVVQPPFPDIFGGKAAPQLFPDP